MPFSAWPWSLAAVLALLIVVPWMSLFLDSLSYSRGQNGGPVKLRLVGSGTRPHTAASALQRHAGPSLGTKARMKRNALKITSISTSRDLIIYAPTPCHITPPSLPFPPRKKQNAPRPCVYSARFPSLGISSPPISITRNPVPSIVQLRQATTPFPFSPNLAFLSQNTPCSPRMEGETTRGYQEAATHSS